MINVKVIFDRNPVTLIKDDIKRKFFYKKLERDIRSLKEKYVHFTNDLFLSVNIETISSCNSDCSFCPVSTKNNKRSKIIMKDEIFQKIVDNLKKIKFKGRICPYVNNELLLDKKIFNRIETLRVIDDDISITIESNGKLLTIEKLYKFFDSGADQVFINDYANGYIDYLFLTKRMRDLLSKIDTRRIKRDVNFTISHRLKKQLLSARSDKVKSRKALTIANKEKYCDFPFNQLNINPIGDIFICCRDSYYDGLMGNINENSLEEIWFNSKYQEVRNAFLENRRILPICDRCTSNGSITV